MDSGDLFFYGILAISVVSSIVKATRKKPETEGADTGMPDFKGSKPGEIFKTVLKEMMEKEDDFIPTNPKPAPILRDRPESSLRVEPLKRSTLSSDYDRLRNATENKPRRESFSAVSTIQTEEMMEDQSDPILQRLDIKQMDELKKGIIYSEILRPKF